MQPEPSVEWLQGTVSFPLRAHWRLNRAKLPGWERLLPAWIRIHSAYTDAFVPNDRELSLYYKERPQVGFLAAAAFAAGGVALEEWGTEKAEGYGRSDLWIRLCPQTTDEDYSIEAKHRSIGFTCDNDLGWCKQIRENHYEAELSTQRVKLEGAKVAVGFASLICNTIDQSICKYLAKEWWAPLLIPETFGKPSTPDGMAILWLDPSSADFYGEAGGPTTVALVITASRLSCDKPGIS